MGDSWPRAGMGKLLRDILIRALVEVLTELVRFLSGNPGGCDGGD